MTGTSVTQRYGAVAPAVLANGYQPIPVRGKNPLMNGWQSEDLTDSTVSKLARRYQGSNAGFRTGQGERAVYAVDIDFYNAGVAKTVRDAFVSRFGQGLERVGQAPKVLLVYQGAPGAKKITSTSFVDNECPLQENGKDLVQRVEVLGDGQQFVGFGKHPTTGRAYEWTGDSPLEVKVQDLPVLDLDEVKAWVHDELPKLMPSTFKPHSSGPKPSAEKSGQISGLSEAMREHALEAVTPSTIEEVRLALDALPLGMSVDYGSWVNVGLALKSLAQAGYEAEALAMWLSFSARAGSAYDEDKAQEKWDEKFDPGAITYKSIFEWAKAAGADLKAISEQVVLAMVVSAPIPYDLSRMAPVEFCVDGFLATGTTVIAGKPGVGKTSLLVPLACEVAHLCPSDSPLTPMLRRKVVYVTEDPVQVQNILYALRKHLAPHIPHKEWCEWFIIEQAHRRAPKALSKLVKEWRTRYAYQACARFNNYMVEPLIVMDTSNATLDLESENDNSEAGRAIAAIKEALGSASLWLIAHVAKGMSRADVADMSVRGAGAFEGDANAVAYVIDEGAVGRDVRYLVLGKRRFQAKYSELMFKTSISSEVVSTPWGVEQEISYLYGAPSIPGPGENREAAKLAKVEEAKAKRQGEMQGEILAFLADAKEPPAMSKVRDMVKGKHVDVQSAIDSLIVKGRVLEVAAKGRKGTCLALNPDYQDTWESLNVEGEKE